MKADDLLVIPCYNEENRLPHELALSLLAGGRIEILLVNDGSTDRTREVIDGLVKAGQGRIHALHMAENSGKAEAVRRGLLWGVEQGARCVGYADADFATPPKEILRLLEAMEAQGLGAVLGCRVARLGAQVNRRFSRHLVSRVFASLASAVLGVSVYDTQCGAKWFRVNPALEATIAEKFSSRWAFDVELLGRLLGRWGKGPRLDDDDVLEIPVRAWRDVGGSKVSLSGMLRAMSDMCRMVIVSMRLGRDYPKSLVKVSIGARLAHPRTSWSSPVELDGGAENDTLPRSQLIVIGSHQPVALGPDAVSTAIPGARGQRGAVAGR